MGSKLYLSVLLIGFTCSVYSLVVIKSDSIYETCTLNSLQDYSLLDRYIVYIVYIGANQMVKDEGSSTFFGSI